MKAVDEAFAWAKTQNQTLKQALKEERKVKAESVKAIFWETALIAYRNAEPSQGAEYAMCAALAAVIPLIQAEEREACVKIAEGNNSPWGAYSPAIATAIRARGEP